MKRNGVTVVSPEVGEAGRAGRAGEMLAELVVAERYRRFWTQGQLADRAGVSRDTISEIERGRARLNGRAVGRVLEALQIGEERLAEICGGALRGTGYEHCLTPKPGHGSGLCDYIDGLRGLSDDRLLDGVAHDPRSSHRMAYLDAIECRWHRYEAFATNGPPLQFRDDASIEAAAAALVGDAEDRDAYICFRRAYREQRLKWLEEHPTRRRQQVVLSAHGLILELGALENRVRAHQLVVNMSNAVRAYPATFSLLVLDTGGARLPEVEIVSCQVLNLFEAGLVVTQGRTTVAVHHLRNGLGHVPTHYDLAVHSDPPFVERFFHRVRGHWFAALGQYGLLEGGMPTSGSGAVVGDLTVARLQDCLNLAYP